MRDIQPVFASFAVIAMVLHAAFWLACALQTPPGLSRSGEVAFVIPICTPEGLRTVRAGSAHGDDAHVPESAQTECPTCAFTCAPTLTETAGIVALYVSGPGFAHPSAPVLHIMDGQYLVPSLGPRAPPASVFAT